MRWCSLSMFSTLYQPVVEELIKRSNVRVAVAPTDESLVLGYAVVEGDTLHWCYVAPYCRRHGMLWYMLEDIADRHISYSHETVAWRRNVAPKLPRWKYRPEVLRGVANG
jgi:hypothetical protein